MHAIIPIFIGEIQGDEFHTRSRKTTRIMFKAYFSRKVFKGIELMYQKIERLSFTVVITTREMKPYF